MPKNLPVLLLTSVILFGVQQKSIAQGLTVTAGGNLVVNGSASIVVNDGKFNNDGTFTAGTGTVILSGTSGFASSTLSGISTLSFYNLGVNKPGSGLRLAKPVAVSNSVMMLTGDIDLNGFDINLGTTGSITGETNSSSITSVSGGAVSRSVQLNAPNAVDVGNMGLVITSAANLGVTVVKRGYQQQTSGSTGVGIKRYYDIVPANNTGLNATVKFTYLEDELAGINESELKMWASADAGTSWTLLGADAQDASANYVLKNGVNQLNRLTLGSIVVNPLPVQLISFSGLPVGSDVHLQWSTAFELNSKHFEVERSADGRNFSAIATIAGAGNSSTLSNYGYIDLNPPGGTLYYRLKEVDMDGRSAYSKLVLVTIQQFENSFVSAYPNPTNGAPVHIRFTSKEKTKAVLLVTDANGRTIATIDIAAEKGLNEISYNAARLAQGTYYLQLNGIDRKVVTLIKN